MVQQRSTARQEIERVNAQYMEAFNRGDAAGAAAVYTNDGVILPPGRDLIRGREGIQQFWQAAMQMGIRRVVLDTIDLHTDGDMAYEIGRATLTIQPEGGQTATDTAKYVVVWKRDTGEWKWALDIWNSNA